MIQVGARVRARRDHQLGFIVEDDAGRLAVKLDRRDEALRPYNPAEWEEDREQPLAPIQVARIAYEADRSLRTILGEYGIKEWILLTEQQRVAWIAGPKTTDPKRLGLYNAVKGALATT